MYNKSVFMFPGQGSQKFGMVQQLYTRSDAARKVFARASELLGYDVADLCFLGASGEDLFQTKLFQTRFSQPAILVASYAAYQALEEICSQKSVASKPDFLLGHSLGEYTAATVSSAISFDDAVRLVQRRGQYMSEVTKPDTGLAVLQSFRRIPLGRVKAVADNHGVYIALVNSDKQIVIGGYVVQFPEFFRQLEKESLVTRATMLLNLGAFHTPITKPAAENLKPYLDGVNMGAPSVKIITNVNGLPVNSTNFLRYALYQQIFKTVNWRDSVTYALEDGADLFIEIGPGTVLSGLVGQIAMDSNKEVKILHVEDTNSLEETVQQLSGK